MLKVTVKMVCPEHGTEARLYQCPSWDAFDQFCARLADMFDAGTFCDGVRAYVSVDGERGCLMFGCDIPDTVRYQDEEHDNSLLN